MDDHMFHRKESENQNRRKKISEPVKTQENWKTLTPIQTDLLFSSTWAPYGYLPYGIWYMY